MAWLLGFAPAVAAEAPNVQMLFSNGRLLPANVEFDRGMSEVFASLPEVGVELSAEFLDAPKFSRDAYGQAIATCLRDKCATRAPEVVIVGGEDAPAFVPRHRPKVFPSAPVVYQSVSTAFLHTALPLPPTSLAFRSNWTVSAPSSRRCAGTPWRGTWCS